MLPPGLDPKVVEVYTAVGKILSRYSAGKIPKAFKVVPTLKNWEEARHWFSDSTHEAVVWIIWQLLRATSRCRKSCMLSMAVRMA